MEEDLTKFTEKFTKHFSTSTPVNMLWNCFKQKCIKSIDTFVPSKMTSTRFSQAWCNHAIRRLSRKKKRVFKKACATKKQSDWHCYKDIQKEAQQACRRAHDDYISNMVSEPGSNKKKLFAYLKDIKCDSSAH